MTTVEFNYKLTSMQKHLEYFAKKLTGNDDDAQDLLQETYLKALVFRVIPTSYGVDRLSNDALPYNGFRVEGNP